MTQVRLTDLAIESEDSETVNFEHTIDIFAHQKARKHTSLNTFIEVIIIYVHVFLELLVVIYKLMTTSGGPSGKFLDCPPSVACSKVTLIRWPYVIATISLLVLLLMM